MVSRILILALALYGVAAFPSVEPTNNSGQTLGTGSQPSNLKTCSKEVKAVAGDTCDKLAEAHGISVAHFHKLNPEVNPKCTNIVVGHEYCV